MNLFLILPGYSKFLVVVIGEMIESKLGVFKINFRSGHFMLIGFRLVSGIWAGRILVRGHYRFKLPLVSDGVTPS